MALTDLKIKAAQPQSKPYHLTDGHGLFLAIHPNGSKLWRWKYRFQGKYRLMAFRATPQSASRMYVPHTPPHVRNCAVELIPWRSGKRKKVPNWSPKEERRQMTGW